MTRFLTSLAFCSFLLLVGAFLMASSSTAKEDIVSQLLALPAPPPPNPLVRITGANKEWVRDKKNPPKDDAPIEELMEYWRFQSLGYRELGYNIMPSPASLSRIQAEIQKDPTSVSQYLNVMRDSPDGAEFVKRIYDNWPEGEDEERDEGRAGVKNWLSMNSSYFSGQVAKTANRAADRGEYVTNQDEMLALAKYDWDAVRPTVDRLYGDSSQPVSRVLATWALYRHALAENSMGDTDRYRDELKAFVEDKKATAGMRDLAFDALVKEKDWNGRDEWYYSLLEDETLAELRINGSLYTGLTTLVIYSPPDKYADKMIELVKSTNPVIRAAAARNLAVVLDTSRPDVVKALLPWLEDPKWAKDVSGSRQQLVRILQTVKIPESVPGLIAAVDEKENVNMPVRDVNANAANAMAYSANMMVNAANMNRGTNSNYASNVLRTINVVNHPLRSEAIGALATQGDMRAVPVLRRILREVEGYERNGLVKAILMCKGFTVAEQADALESLAKNVREQQANAVEAASNAMNAAANAVAMAANGSGDWGDPPAPSRRISSRADVNPDELKQMLGMQLLQIEEAGDPLVRELIARITLLEKSDPPVSEVLRMLLLNWKGPAINALLLKDLKDDKASAAGVLKLLSVRKDLREKQSGDVFDIRTANPTAAGIAACLLESESDYAAILGGDNAEAKAAMLSCARLIRAKIPVETVARYLSNKDKRLAMAAERYLESEDSPEARSIVLSIHPNEAKIMGATTAFWPEGKTSEPTPLILHLFGSVNENFLGSTNIYSFFFSGDFKELEKRLQNEIKEDAELSGIYSYTNNFIRIYKDKAVYSWEEDQSRYHERTLSKEEFDYLTGYLTHHRVDDLAPFLACSTECSPKQLLMLGKHGGRRVFSNSTREPEFFSGLEAIFKDLRQSPAKLRYTLEKNIPGLEILFTNEDKTAKTVWKNGGDLRLLIADKSRRKEIDREIVEASEAMEESEGDEEDPESLSEQKVWELRRKRVYDNYAWFKFDDGKLAEPAAQPEQAEFLPVRDSFAVQPPVGQWKAKAAGIEIRGDSDGLHKIAGGKITKIRSGHYDSPVITANGRWVVATKYTDDEGSALIRVNLVTNKEFPIKTDDLPVRQAVAYVPSVNKVLTTGMDYNEYEEYEGSPTAGRIYYWLDAETGVIMPATGEIQPLGQQKFRSLQPAQNPFEFWAAIHDRKKNATIVGVYNSKTFILKPSLTIPKIEFDSMDMWVDSAAGKVYFVYSGHLLALPLTSAAGK